MATPATQSTIVGNCYSSYREGLSGGLAKGSRSVLRIEQSPEAGQFVLRAFGDRHQVAIRLTGDNLRRLVDLVGGLQ